MTRWCTIILLIIFSLPIPSYAQKKIKYKDLYPLFQANRYSEGEPFVRKFLKEEPDHANANFQLATALERKTYSFGLFENDSLVPFTADTAILYFNTAKKFIDEKELRKNDEYWQEFNRRDLRTGDFGIKVSDVHLNIEERIEKLKKYKENYQLFTRHFQGAEKSYRASLDLFDTLTRDYSSFNEFLLAGSLGARKDILQVKAYYDSFSSHFERMKDALQSLNADKYNPELIVNELTGIPQEQPGFPDFQSNEIVVYHLGNWAEKVNTLLATKILPLRTKIWEYYQELESVSKRVSAGEDIDESQLPEAINTSVRNAISEFDSASVLFPFFELEIMNITYNFYSSENYHPALKDSFNIDAQIDACDLVLDKTRHIDSVAQILTALDEKKEILKYPDFLKSTYDTPVGFEGVVKDQIAYLRDERVKWKNRKSYWVEKGRFIIIENDSIPLFVNDSSIFLDYKYQTRIIFRADSSVLATGFTLDDEPMAYVVGVTNSRKLLFRQNFPLDDLIGEERLDSLKVKKIVTNADKLVTIYYLNVEHTETSGKQLRLLVLKNSIKGENIWKIQKQLPGHLKAIEYDDLVDEVKIYYEKETDGGSEIQYALIDSEGNWN